MFKYITIGGAILGLLIVFMLGGSLMESVDANEIVLIQSIGGNMTWHTTPGVVWQGFGKVTRYAKRGIIQFQPAAVQGEPDGRLPIVFNDAGRGAVKGSINYELPLDTENLTELHSAYPTLESLERGLIRPALNKSVFLTGTTMSSYESYKEKRSALIQYVEDQTQNGVYQTRTVEKEIDEETLGANGQTIVTKKKVSAVEIAEANGQRLRNETGQLSRFGVKAFNFAIEDLDYDNTVDQQIKDQQSITMAVQTSIANAKKSIQDAVTAEATGRANIAQARAEQEIGKTQAVVAGEKQRDVAKLKSEEAAFYKTEQLLRADADSEYRRRMMSADNALDRRLQTVERINNMWASAFAQAGGKLVPQIVMGSQGGSGNGMGATQNFMDLLAAKAAKDLGVELNVGGK